MEKLLSQANQIIVEALKICSRSYIAFSGGKDSLVVAHLVSQVNSNIPMVYCDDELLYPEHVEFINAAKERMGERLRIVVGGSLHRQWFRPWVMWPRWREPHPSMEWHKWQLGQTITPGHLASRLGYNAVFLGLRRQESLRRADILIASTGIDELGQITYINPILEWSDDDVWNYILNEGLEYCTVYDRLADIGVSRHHARLGPLPLSQGEHLWKGWPDLYIALIQRYGLRWTRPGHRKPHDMDNLTWLELQDTLR